MKDALPTSSEPGDRDAAATPRSLTPHYWEILTGSQWLIRLATVAAALGWLFIIAGTFLLAGVAFVAATAPGFRWESFRIPLLVLLLGIAGLFIAAMLRLFSSLALAVRDIARNSAR